MTAISRSHHYGQFGSDPTIDQKIEIFNERVLGWQIDVAEDMSRQFIEAGDDLNKPMRHCGFAIVSVVFSYFETIAQYLQGASSLNRSTPFFKYGFRAVYPAIELEDWQIGTIYKYIRCGMYHNGSTHPGVNISRSHWPTFSFDANCRLLLNPFTLVDDVKQHFVSYIGCLRNCSCTAERDCFETIFDDGAISPDISQYGGSGAGY